MKKLQRTAAALALLSITSPIFAGEPSIGQWGIHGFTDAITDKKILNAGVGTEDGMIFMLQCSGDRFGAVIVPFKPMVKMEFITMDEMVDVAWRIDSKPAVFERWMVLTGKAGSAYSVLSLSTNELVSAVLAGGEKITFRVHGLTTSVTLEGESQYVTEALQACGLKP